MIRSLPEVRPYSHADFLRSLKVARVAHRVGCGTNYLYQVLSGNYRPGVSLDKKLQDLVKELKHEH